MTFLGKVLVLLNLGLSWLFAAWALGLYTHRIDWAPRPKGAGPTTLAAEPSRIEDLTAQIKRSYEIQDPAETRYQANLAAQQRLEAQRALMKGWYADQMHIIWEGMNLKNEPAAIQELTVKDGQLVIDPMGRQALMINDKPPLSLNGYLKKIKDQQDEVAKEQDEIKKLIIVFEATTKQIAAVQTSISGQEVLVGRQKEEVKTLVPLLLNYTAEGELLKKRKGSLTARVKELEQLPPTVGEP